MLDLVTKVVAGIRVGVVLRYLIASAFNVVNHQILLQIAVQWWGWSGGWANVFAAMTSVMPGYLISRYWVWEVEGKPNVRSEIVPFWIIAAVGLVVSTVAAEAADRRFESDLLISVASLTAYLVVWVTKFIVLNHLFSRTRKTSKLAEI